MSKVEETAAELIIAIDGSFSKGYLFHTKDGRIALLTTKEVLNALMTDGEVMITEPAGEHTPAFHRGRVR